MALFPVAAIPGAAPGGHRVKANDVQHLDDGLPLTAFAVEEHEINARPEAQHAAEMLGHFDQEVDTSPFAKSGRHE